MRILFVMFEHCSNIARTAGYFAGSPTNHHLSMVTLTLSNVRNKTIGDMPWCMTQISAIQIRVPVSGSVYSVAFWHSQCGHPV